MLYFGLASDATIIAVGSDHKEVLATPGVVTELSRWDFKDLETAEAIARRATEVTGDTHLAVDYGEWRRPQFDVVRAPKVGDKVSYGFNGDYRPDGEIVKVSPKFIVTTSTGNTYRRKKLTASWMRGGTWSLVRGHIDKLNPEF